METKIRKLINAYTNCKFENGTTETTKQFKSFARKYRNILRQICENANCSLVSYNINHFTLSGYIHNQVTDKFCYFSINDVRHGGIDDAFNNILIRTTFKTNDCVFNGVGGTNYYSTIYNLGRHIYSLTR